MVDFIIGIIIILGILDLFFLIKERVFYNGEIKNIEEVQIRIKKHSNPHDFYSEMKVFLSSDSIVFKKINLLYLSIERKAKTWEGTTETDLIVENTYKFKQYSDFIVSSLLIIGLAGTFLSLNNILGSSGLNEVVVNNQIEVTKYQSAINNVYSGFRGAFLASICGIVGTVILLFLRYVFVIPKRNEFLDGINQISSLEVIPLFSSMHKSSEDVFSDVALKLDHLMGSMNPSVQGLNNASTKAIDAISAMVKFSDNLKIAADIFGKLTSPDSPFIVANELLFETFERNEKRHVQYQDEFTKIFSLLSTQNLRLSETHDKFIELHGLLKDQNSRLSEDMENLFKKYQQSISGLAENFIKGSQQVLMQSSTNADKIGNSLIDFNKGQALFSDEVVKLNQLFGKWTIRVNEQLSRWGDIASSSQIQSEIKRISKELSEINDGIRSIKFPSGIENSQARSISEGSNYIEEIEKIISKIEFKKNDLLRIQRNIEDINQTLKSNRFKVTIF